MSSNAISIADVQAGRQITVPRSLEAVAPFSSMSAFESAQRMATALNASSMVPKQYQGRDNLGNALVALELAHRTQTSVFAVMQNLDVINGRPSWSAKFLIATVNQSGRFAEPLDYEFKGTEGKDDWSCRAFTKTHTGKVVTGPWVSIEMAKKEGWYGKGGSKWQTMPGLMIVYRAGSFFARTVCPDIAMGMITQEEARELDPIEIDPATGEVLNRQPRIRTITPAQAGGATVVDMSANLTAQTAAAADDCDLPWSAAEGDDAKLAAAPANINAHGEVWNPEIHATSSETGGPILTKDGHFRARRGAQAQAPAVVNEQAEDPTPTPVGNYDLD